MKTFSLNRDRKITCWERDKYAIEAETEKEALEKLQQMIENEEDYEEPEFIESEILFDTIEEMCPEENNNQSTVEILNSKTGETLWENVKPNI